MHKVCILFTSFLKFDHIYHKQVLLKSAWWQFEDGCCYYSRPKKSFIYKTRSFFKSTNVIHGPPGVFHMRIYPLQPFKWFCKRAFIIIVYIITYFYQKCVCNIRTFFNQNSEDVCLKMSVPILIHARIHVFFCNKMLLKEWEFWEPKRICDIRIIIIKFKWKTISCFIWLTNHYAGIFIWLSFIFISNLRLMTSICLFTPKHWILQYYFYFIFH